MREASPEEKLLNLIKRKKKKEAPPGPRREPFGHAGKKAVNGPPLLDLGNIVKIEHIRSLNFVLFIILIGIILYFLIDVFVMSPAKVASINQEKGLNRSPGVKEIEAKPYAYYSKNLKKKVFKPLTRETKKASMPEVPVEELMGNLALLGIVSGDRPQAIIEDRANKKSFFLREGQSASGVFLKEIDDGSVTVIYKGEEFNLTL